MTSEQIIDYIKGRMKDLESNRFTDDWTPTTAALLLEYQIILDRINESRIPTVEGFKEFLKSKGNSIARIGDCFNCPFAEYLKSLGYKTPEVLYEMYQLESNNFKPWIPLPEKIEKAIKATGRNNPPFSNKTYAMVLKELEAL